MDELLTVEEVSQRLKVSKQCVYDWIYNGKLKALKAGGVIRIEESEYNRFIGKDGDTHV